IYVQVVDAVHDGRKKTMDWQMSLFDMMDEESKNSYDITLPPVGEYNKDQLLEFEKEVLGIYVSGHPLEAVKGKWEENITNKTTDFISDEETEARVKDHQRVIVGGIITSLSTKITKTGKPMAFITIEDLVGTIEVIIFPREYERYRNIVTEDNKIFIIGEASIEADGTAKILCQNIQQFSSVASLIWIQCMDMEDYNAHEEELYEIIKNAPGRDVVGVYLKKEKAKKLLPNEQRIDGDETTIALLETKFGKENVKKVDKRSLKL
ncbi:MAG: OB-fold nucleic acid binding domain-containing protein, partial [Eubacterium sp.]